MKAKPLRITENGYIRCEPIDATHLRLHFPGPFPNRILPVMIGGTRRGTGNWTWNGDIDKPTVKPSILTRGGDIDGEHVCHSFVNDGMIQFLSDCSHEFANQTVELLDIDEDVE